MKTPISRRDALKTIGCSLAATAAYIPFTNSLSANPKKTFKIGACDWSIGHRYSLGAMALAKELGLDGVQVSFGQPGSANDLRDARNRKAYYEVSQKYGVEVASLAMGLLNDFPYASYPDAEAWAHECLDVMKQMNQKIVLLAFFGKGDIKNEPELQKAVIRKLKVLAPKAEKAGMIIGLETWLSADEHLYIIDAVGSPAVQVYYDTANSNKMGYDIYEEIERLGTEHICEIHMKENGALLGQGIIDFERVRDILEDVGYHDWLIIEGARPKGAEIKESYLHNREYLQAVFNA